MKLKSKGKIIDKAEFLIIYAVLLFFSGYYFFENTATVGRIIIMVLLFVIFSLNNSKIPIKVLQWAILLIANVLVTQIITGFDIVLTVLFSVTIAEAALFVSTVPFRNFRKQFTNCMVVIAVVSLIGNLFLAFSPNVLSIFPRISNSNGKESIFLLFGMISDFSISGSYRNQGIFWEPGAYQVFLCIAYIFKLYEDNKKKSRRWILILYWISLISTMSTTGIIVAIALLVLTFGRGNLSVIKLTMSALVIVLATIAVLPHLDGYWKYALVTKIDQILNYQMGVSNEASSRMDSLVYVGIEFMHSPIWGIGTSGFLKLATQIGHSMFTCTPINWIARYGIFFGGFVYYNLADMLIKVINSKFETILALGIICVSVFSEEFSENLFFVILMFYGLSGWENYKSGGSAIV